MPTYVYRCRDCQKSVEVLQRFSDDPLTICPHCGGGLQRVFFPPAVIFKGSGWYCTDHKSPSGNGFAGSKLEEPVAAQKTAEDSDGNGSDMAKKTAGGGDKSQKTTRKASEAGS